MSYKVYLAGPIAGLSYKDATDWRDSFYFGLCPNIELLSPMRSKKYLENETNLQDAYKNPLSTSKGITTRDRWDVSRCDAMVVNFLGATKVSIGTCVECGWADSYRKPVIVIMEPDNVHKHAMIKEIAGYIVGSVDEAKTIVNALFELGD